jgi:DNA-binding PadR family transcriptional regulator
VLVVTLFAGRSRTVLTVQASTLSPAALEERDATLPECGQPSRELLMAWLLLLLHRRPGHGYDLQRRLETHGVTTESGAMYRALRRLEHDEFAQSTWAKSASGPQRRLYRVTTKGRRELETLVGAITVKRDVHAAFLDAHDEALQ